MSALPSIPTFDRNDPDHRALVDRFRAGGLRTWLMFLCWEPRAVCVPVWLLAAQAGCSEEVLRSELRQMVERGHAIVNEFEFVVTGEDVPGLEVQFCQSPIELLNEFEQGRWS